MAAEFATNDAFDTILDAATYAHGHPFEIYDQLRSETPVGFCPAKDDRPAFHVLTRYDDIRATSMDSKRFTSTRGFNTSTSRLENIDNPIVASILQNILGFDPPLHTEFKRALLPSFTPAKLAQLEVQTREFTRAMLSRYSPGDTVEFVSEIAAPIPIRVLCNLLGIPLEDEHKIFDWTNKLVGGEDPRIASDPQSIMQAYFEVFDYGRRMIEDRTANPRDDLMSRVAAATLDGQPLSVATRDGMCATIIAAGNETTRNSMSGFVQLLSSAPDQRRQLAKDISLLPNAIEEALRRHTPVIHMTRAALEPVEIGGKLIQQGERIAMLYGAANHDPEVFENPYRFDIHRENARKHLAFGAGIHLCIGQRLAQMELKVLFEELLSRFPETELLSAPDYLQSGFICAIRSMEVQLK